MKQIAGGVCAATGFSASGVHCGIRKNKTKRDLALIYSSVPASAAAVYTTNLVKGAPLVVTKQHLADGKAQAIICNSGNANTCNANGIEIAEQTSSLLGQTLHIKPSDVVVASTGVIGQPLTLRPSQPGSRSWSTVSARTPMRLPRASRPPTPGARRSPSASLPAGRNARSAASAKAPA